MCQAHTQAPPFKGRERLTPAAKEEEEKIFELMRQDGQLIGQFVEDVATNNTRTPREIVTARTDHFLGAYKKFYDFLSRPEGVWTQEPAEFFEQSQEIQKGILALQEAQVEAWAPVHLKVDFFSSF